MGIVRCYESPGGVRDVDWLERSRLLRGSWPSTASRAAPRVVHDGCGVERELGDLTRIATNNCRRSIATRTASLKASQDFATVGASELAIASAAARFNAA